ncbi:MAG: hypothetical protein PUJ57_02755 [Peptoniphilaceae bacterium]|nr:hypothetical protein [Peptoniphilaceae bacterium]
MKALFDKTPPWRGKGEVIEGAHNVPLSGWKLIYAYALTFFLIGLGIFTKFKLTLLLAVLLLFALVTKRYAAVTSYGLETFANMIVTTNHRRVPWADIDTLTYEKVAKMPEKTVIYFTMGDVTRRVLFPTSERRRVVKFAQKYRPDIKVYDGNAFRAEATEKYLRRKKKKDQENEVTVDAK